MKYYEIIITIVASLLSITSVFLIFFSSREKRRNSSRQERLEERYEYLIHNLFQIRDSEIDRRMFNSGKGFSDGYDEIRYLLKEIRSLRSDFRREMTEPISINTDQIVTQVSKTIQQSLCDYIKPAELSKLILS